MFKRVSACDDEVGSASCSVELETRVLLRRGVADELEGWSGL